MMDYIISLYGEVSFQTNFWKQLFDKFDYLDEIVKRKEKIKYITTDICSGNPEEHEFIKKGSRYDETLEQLSYIAKKADNILIDVTAILTRSHYENFPLIIPSFIEHGIRNIQLSVVNLMSYDYSEFTASDNVYISTDYKITTMLKELVNTGKKFGVPVSIPQPADKTSIPCPMFWKKFQTWPTKGCSKQQYIDNMIPCACAATVNGELYSLGHLFEYDNIMDAWNNEKLVKIRENIILGNYPDENCKKCYLYHKKDGFYKLKVNQLKKANKRFWI